MLWKQGLIVIFILREMQEAIWNVTSSVNQFSLNLSDVGMIERKILRDFLQQGYSNTQQLYWRISYLRTTVVTLEQKISHYNIYSS